MKDSRTIGMRTSDDGTMVLVEMLLPGYQNEKRWQDIDSALLGAAKGKWKIVPSPEVMNEYDTRVMFPEHSPLTQEDLTGPKEKRYETKVLKKKHVAWVEDRWIEGGAEISGDQVVKVGEECGFCIERLTHVSDPQFMAAVFKQSDVIVLNNIWGFSDPQLKAIFEAVYSSRIPYIKYEHDHRELGRPEVSRRLFGNSILNVFLSPIHLKNHQEVLGCSGIARPLAIDVDLYHPNGNSMRKEGHALVSNVRNFKTWNNLQAYIVEHPEIEFTVLGGKSVIAGSNVRTRESVPHREMPALYSEYEYVVHLLDGWGAGERVVFEGALCGCKIVANSKVGHLSWGKDLSAIEELKDWLRAAPFEFWKDVEERVQGNGIQA